MKNLKNSATTINIFLLLLFYTELYKKIFFLENIVCQKTQFVPLHSYYQNYLKCSNETPTPIGLVEAILRPKILDIRLSILTENLKVFHIIEKCLIFRKEQKHVPRNVSTYSGIIFQTKYISKINKRLSKRIGKFLLVSEFTILLNLPISKLHRNLPQKNQYY